MSGHEQLHKALDDLQAHLEEMRQLNPDVAKHLDTTIEQAKGVLAGDTAAEHHTVSQQFRDAVQHYEATHPTLAGSLRSVIDALAQIGI